MVSNAQTHDIVDEPKAVESDIDEADGISSDYGLAEESTEPSLIAIAIHQRRERIVLGFEAKFSKKVVLFEGEKGQATNALSARSPFPNGGRLGKAYDQPHQFAIACVQVTGPARVIGAGRLLAVIQFK